MYVSLLGPVSVTTASGRIAIPSRQVRSLLAILVLARGRFVPASSLMESLWDSDELKNRRNAMQATVSRLRRVLADGTDAELELGPGGYALRFDHEEVDVHQFDTLVVQAEQLRRTDPDAALGRYRQALALWQGTPFDDLVESPALRAEFARIQENRLSALEASFELQLELGHPHAVVRDLRPLVELHADRESFAELLMLTLYRCGRQTEALEVYRRLRTRLSQEFGLDPSRRTQRVHQLILRQDDSALLSI